MIKTYTIRYRMIAYVVLISLFLPGCTHSFNPPLSAAQQTEYIQSPLAEKKLLSKQGYMVLLKQEKGALQAKVVDKHTNVTYTVPVYIEQGADITQILNLPIEVQKRLIYTELPRDGQEGLVWIGSAGLMGGGKGKRKEIEEAAEKSQELVESKRRKVLEAALKEKEQAPIEEHSSFLESAIQDKNLATKMLKGLGKEDLYEQPIEGENKEGAEGLPLLPIEIWTYILSYVVYPAILSCRLVNRGFYEMITGDSRLGLVVAESKPASISSYWWANKDIDCRGMKPDETPSFAFYQLIRSVRNLPPAFWPYLQGAQVHSVDFTRNNIGAVGVTELAKHLKGTSVHTLDLKYNGIGAQGAEALAQVLAQSQVHTLHLGSNRIGAQGAAALAKVLAQSQVRTLILGSNYIGDEGAEALAEVLARSQVHTLNLTFNNIGDIGAAALAKVLAESQVYTLALRFNEIGDKGAEALAKVLAHSQVHALYLNHNRIGAVGAEALAQGLAQSHVHTLNLGYNKIRDEGAEALAKVLAHSQVHTLNLGSNRIGDAGVQALVQVLAHSQVHTLYLANNQIGGETQFLLIEKYPHIKCRF